MLQPRLESQPLRKRDFPSIVLLPLELPPGFPFWLFSIDGYGSIRTYDSADAAPRADFLGHFRRMITLGGQSIHIKYQDFLWTGFYAQTAAFAVIIVHYNPSGNSHAKRSFLELDIRDIDCLSAHVITQSYPGDSNVYIILRQAVGR
jgi:hypothetical protein